MPYKRRYYRRPKKSIHNMVKKMIQNDKEQKRAQNEFTNLSQSTTGLNTAITDIATGDGIGNRDGHEIFLNKFRARYAVVAGDTTNEVRFILYSKKDVSGSDIAASTRSALDYDNYTIYLDKLCVVGTGELIKVCNLKKTWPGRGKKVLYDTTSSTSQTQGEVLMYTVSDSGAATHPTMNGHYELFFKE